MGVTTAPCDAAALLLVATAVTKARHPRPAGEMMRALGLPTSPFLVHLVCVAELAAGAGVLFVGDREAAAGLAVLYAALAAVAATVLARGVGRSCGCTGRNDTPISRWHVAVSLYCAAWGAAGAGWPPGHLSGSAPRVGAVVVAGLVLTGVGWWAVTRPAPAPAAPSPPSAARTGSR